MCFSSLESVPIGQYGGAMSSSWGDIPDWSYEAVTALMQALAVNDPETYRHCCRVGEMSRKLAKDAGLNSYQQKVAEFSGLLHDIGKMGIPQQIITKPSRLDDSEMDIMRSHPVLSEQIVNPLAKSEFFKELLPGIRGHHERVDGNGYPDKLFGDQISLVSRVILVVDTYDAMSQTRAYRKGLPNDIIYAELKKCSGTQFDQQLVRIFLDAHKSWNASEVDKETAEYIIKKVA